MTVAKVSRFQELDADAHDPAPGLFGLVAEQGIAFARRLDETFEPLIVEVGADVQSVPAVTGGDAL
jgi:hypothetical protein